MINLSSLTHLENARVLITGGTGSLGTKLTPLILDRVPTATVVIYSRDEYKQFQMQQTFTAEERVRLRFFLGDVRDGPRLRRAMEGTDVVIHAAALKQVPAAEYNPFEAVKTNVLGVQNVIEAALDSGVKRVVALSTDKAAAPINLYGATKLCSDKLFIAANNMRGHRDIRFSVVRYGNVMGSRGSVIPFFLERRKTGILPITHPDMTRFNISLEEGVNMVLYALEHALGGEIFVPKIPSYRITDLAEAIGPDCEKPVVGIRPGEKLHEEMITESDSPCTVENHYYYVIVPSFYDRSRAEVMASYAARHKASPVPARFRYSSGSNSEWLRVEQLRELIRKHVEPGFTV